MRFDLNVKKIFSLKRQNLKQWRDVKVWNGKYDFYEYMTTVLLI